MTDERQAYVPCAAGSMSRLQRLGSSLVVLAALCSDSGVHCVQVGAQPSVFHTWRCLPAILSVMALSRGLTVLRHIACGHAGAERAGVRDQRRAGALAQHEQGAGHAGHPAAARGPHQAHTEAGRARVHCAAAPLVQVFCYLLCCVCRASFIGAQFVNAPTTQPGPRQRSTCDCIQVRAAQAVSGLCQVWLGVCQANLRPALLAMPPASLPYTVLYGAQPSKIMSASPAQPQPACCCIPCEREDTVRAGGRCTTTTPTPTWAARKPPHSPSCAAAYRV